MEQETLQTQSNKKQNILVAGLVCGILVLTFGIYYLTNSNMLLQKRGQQTSEQPNTKPAETTSANIPSAVTCYQFKNLEKALQRIDIACILDLNGTAQDKTLSDLAKLTNLNEINLSNNNLTEFPEVLFGLKNLLVINLSNNELSTIPEKIKSSGLAQSLQILELTGNPISASQKEIIKALLPNAEITF
mgnify:CR=1 FL=1